MSKKSDTPYYIGLGIIILIFGYFAVTNVIDYIQADKVVDSNRSEDRDPVADKFLKKFNQVPDFQFINQDGDTVTNKDLLGKVYIVDFFFTTCPTICTPMSRNMSQINEKLSKYEDYTAVSISIDPDNDTPAVLKEYASRYDAQTTDWQFLTGDKQETYKLAKEGFNAYVGESDNPAVRFEHSGNFALVDRDGYIRSRKDAYGNWTYVYSGISENDLPAQLEEIMEDAETLLNN
ncbi:SCO family protein [Nonlabens marinus]|uniref:Cytochrome oxidase biogenesis protein Sco1/SenC/PrrC, putative copper metallochaperone n=1 Tax=Nonlabens marinus S1-08 TaxID=1454201 RepID=W8VNV8_9FLAO|nr:SCO family protein [Nonlabens marinus]BAO54669.1 cytochrome oxidase biogenesis protein Sco1/SenC/PrrC, putative copper metallochaperone [Nonlabens marinus S1-08]